MMKRSHLFVGLILLLGFVLPRAAEALSIDLKEADAGIPLPWLLFGAFVIALIVTLIIRWLIGRGQRDQQPEG